MVSGDMDASQAKRCRIDILPALKDGVSLALVGMTNAHRLSRVGVLGGCVQRLAV